MPSPTSILKDTYLYRLPKHLVEDIFKRYVGCTDHLNNYTNCKCQRLKHEWDIMRGKRTNDKVVLAWIMTRPFKSNNMRTDGHRLYSYNLCMGETDNDGQKVLGEFTAKGVFYSITTSTHCNKAKRVADKVIMPSE